MNKKTFWIIAGAILVILLLLVIWQTLQISAIGSGTAESVIKNAVNTASSNGMVGGC